MPADEREEGAPSNEELYRTISEHLPMYGKGEHHSLIALQLLRNRAEDAARSAAPAGSEGTGAETALARLANAALDDARADKRPVRGRAMMQEIYRDADLIRAALAASRSTPAATSEPDLKELAHKIYTAIEDSGGGTPYWTIIERVLRESLLQPTAPSQGGSKT